MVILIRIDLANRESAEIICKIHNESFRYYIDKFGKLYGYIEITKKDVIKWFVNDSIILIAYFDNHPVGYLHGQIEYHEKENFSSLNIVETTESLGQSKIAVLPDYRRKKVATNLIKEVTEIARKRNVNVIMFFAYNDNSIATNLFKKLKFKHKQFHIIKSFSEEKPLAHDSVLAEYDLQKKLPVIELNLDVDIRKINKNDLTDLQQIFGECRPDVFGKNPSLNQIKEWYKSKWAQETLVAHYKGKTIGCMEYTKLGIIGIPGILKDYRRKKIGSTLFYFLLYNMQKRGLKKALADTGYTLEEAISMYKKFGFDLSRELWVWLKEL
ncbi:MAG: GNAT family N-acetyltransferase [Asgard group archaeon]|nr:GNAT family N-acetyltransferase [Asgard group archaeon]